MSGSARKRLHWCLGLVCVFAACFAVFVWLSPKLRVSRETFSLIRRQMTEAEIECLLGGKGSKAVLPMAIGEGAVSAWTDPDFRGSHESLNLKQWRTPENCIKVGFDADGKAAYAILTTGMAGMTLWQRIRWWIGI